MRSEVLAILNDDEFASYICAECESIFGKKTKICPNCKAVDTIGKIEITPKLYDEDFGLFEDEEECGFCGGKSACSLISAAKASTALDNNEFDLKIQACSSGIPEFDSLFGNKTIAGTFHLLIGPQSSGKTTFFLKIAEGYSKNNHKTLYISSDESSWQITDKIQRMNIGASKLFLSQANDIDIVINEIANQKPEIVFLDSMSGFFRKQIDAIQSSNIQIRECSAELAKLAKEKNITIFAIANDISSSTIHEYNMISYFFDSILSFELPRHNIKMLRVNKSRNSDTGAVSLFYSDHNILRPLGEVERENLLKSALDNQKYSGRIGKISCFYDESGINMYNELESIVSGFPTASARWNIFSGISRDTFETIVMIIEKYNDINLHDKNINIRLKNPARIVNGYFDLSIAASIISSYYNIPISNQALFIGSLDYSGAVTPAELTSDKLEYIKQSGFKTVISSNLKKENYENHLNEVNFYNIQNIKYLQELLSSLYLDAEKRNG